MSKDTPLPYFDSQDSSALFAESMTLTLQTIGDEMPEGHTKYIHTEGATAQVKLVNIQDHPFTGVFQGADHGLMRLSMAAQPDTSSDTTVPSFGLKFLRDGTDSANVVAEYSVDGQESWNFFKNDFSNHIFSTGAPTPGVEAIANLFATGTPWISTIGVLNWAQWDQYGNAVSSPVLPFSLRFHPSGLVEFSESYDGTNFLD